MKPPGMRLGKFAKAHAENMELKRLENHDHDKRKTLEERRAMNRAQVMAPPLGKFAMAHAENMERKKLEKHDLEKKKMLEKKRKKYPQRGDSPRGGEKGTPVPIDFQGTRSVDAPVKYPRLPTEAQLRDNASKRAAMVVRGGLDASKPQDRLKSLRPY